MESKFKTSVDVKICINSLVKVGEKNVSCYLASLDHMQ